MANRTALSGKIYAFEQNPRYFAYLSVSDPD